MTDKENDRPDYIFEDGEIKVRLTKDRLENPNDPRTHSLEAVSRRLCAEWVESGLPVYATVAYSKDKPKHHASFVLRKKQTHKSEENWVGNIPGTIEVAPGLIALF